jgi:hypothetical protein
VQLFSADDGPLTWIVGNRLLLLVFNTHTHPHTELRKKVNHESSMEKLLSGEKTDLNTEML